MWVFGTTGMLRGRKQTALLGTLNEWSQSIAIDEGDDARIPHIRKVREQVAHPANNPPKLSSVPGSIATLNRSILLLVSRETAHCGDWMVELVNANHEVFPGQSKTVTFTIPAPAK